MGKKIVILTDQVSNIGGITRLIYLKSNFWVNNKGYSVTVITTEQKNKSPFYNIDKKVNIIDLSIDYNRNISYFSPKNSIKILENYFKLQKTLNKLKPDIVIVANKIPVTLFTPFLFSKAKFVKEFHNSRYHISKKKKTLFNKYESWVESKFDNLVVLSPEERDFFSSKNTTTIPNPVIYNEVEPSYDLRKKTAIAAGRISQVKGFNAMIDIWAEFVKYKKDWKLEIYGSAEDPNYYKLLKKKINTLGINEYVEIKGSTNKIEDIMKTAGLYLMTSEMECFPMVLLEAQSCGLPIISYNCHTGPRNILTNNVDGILVEMDNKQKFVEQLNFLTNNESKRIELAKNGYTNTKNYTLEKVMEMWDTKIINN